MLVRAGVQKEDNFCVRDVIVDKPQWPNTVMLDSFFIMKNVFCGNKSFWEVSTLYTNIWSVNITHQFLHFVIYHKHVSFTKVFPGDFRPMNISSNYEGSDLPVSKTKLKHEENRGEKKKLLT